MNNKTDIMRIQIEDYFGNEVVVLKFSLLDVNTTESRVSTLDNLINEYGYSIADVDNDEQGEFVRIQQSHIIDDSEEFKEEEKVTLVNLITNLMVEFL